MPTNNAEYNRIYDKLETMQKIMSDGFSKIEKDIEKLEKQGNEQAARAVKIETLFNAHISEYQEFKKENEKTHTDLFGKFRAICEKEIPQQIRSAQSGIYLKIIGVVFATLIPIVGVGLTILGMVLK